MRRHEETRREKKLRNEEKRKNGERIGATDRARKEIMNLLKRVVSCQKRRNSHTESHFLKM